MAKKQAKSFEQAYYPDLPNFDMGRIEKQQAPSLYDDLSRWLAQAWYGEDPVGMNKARRAVDVGQFAIPPLGMAIGANEVTRNARQGKSPGEGLKGVLLSGIVPVPGAKLGPEIKKAAHTVDDAVLKLKEPTKNLLGVEVPESQLANNLKSLKAKQEEDAALASLKKTIGTDKPTSIEPLDTNFSSFDNSHKDTMTDYQLNTDASYDDLDAFFNGNIPEYSSLNETQLDELEQFVKESKIGIIDYDLNEPDIEDLPASPPISHGSNKGIDVSHISSHKFDDFRMDKVLTGEGTGMEGIGPYTTNEPHVLPYYKRQFTTANTKMFPHDAPRQKAAETVANYIGGSYTVGNADAANLKAATSEAIQNMEQYRGVSHWNKQDDETLKILRDWDKNGVPEGAVSTPYQYDVNLDIDPNKLPDYRIPLIDQNKDVMKTIRDAYESHPGVSPTGNTGIKNYEDIYNEIFRAEMQKRGLKNPTHVGSVRPDKYGTDSEDVTIAKKLIEDHGSIADAAKWVDDNAGTMISTTEADALNAALVHIEDSSIPNTPAGVQAKQIVEHFKNDTTEALKWMYDKGYYKYDPNLSQDITKILQGWHNTGVDFSPKKLGTPRDAGMATSAYLYKKGIPGHKYLPGEGVYGDQGTRNFVSYHHEYMKIIKRIKLALAAGVPTAILASQYGQDHVDAAQSQ